MAVFLLLTAHNDYFTKSRDYLSHSPNGILIDGFYAKSSEYAPRDAGTGVSIHTRAAICSSILALGRTAADATTYCREQCKLDYWRRAVVCG